jgi:hypothetical protein
MLSMVEHQNLDLAKQERLYNAKQSIMPEWTTYLKRAGGMDAANQKQTLSNIVEKFNSIAGTNYKVGSVDGMEPWKSTIIDDDEASIVDLMDFVKTPQELRSEAMMNSPAYRQMEGAIQGEHNMDQALKAQSLQAKQAKATEAVMSSPEVIQQKKQQMIKSGQIPKGAILFDELQGKELQYALDRIKTDIEKGPQAEAGLRALDRMEQIFEKYPNISTSLVRWANSNKREDSLLGNFINIFSDQNLRDAVIELEKDANTLALGVVQQFKGQRPTDVLKKIMTGTVPGGKFTKGAFKPLKSEISGELEKAKKTSIEGRKGYNGRYVPPYDIPEEATQAAQPVKAIKLPPGVTPTPEDLEKFRAKGIEVMQ